MSLPGTREVERRPALHGAAEFVSWTWEMINAGAECAWSPDGTEIIIKNPERLQANRTPTHTTRTTHRATANDSATSQGAQIPTIVASALRVPGGSHCGRL